jgi:hypothetical protein
MFDLLWETGGDNAVIGVLAVATALGALSTWAALAGYDQKSTSSSSP